jgi:cell division septal protein FtsQ
MAKRRPTQLRLSAEAIRNIALGVIALIVLFFAIRSVLSLTAHSELFTVKDIVFAESIGPIDIPELAKLKGRNIFAVSIGKIEARIRGKYPSFANLKVVRRLPDQILVTAVKRTPFAKVLVNGASYLVDRDGFLIRAPGQDDGSLPLVKGLSPQKPVIGEAVSDARLSTAFQIIELFRNDVMLAVVPLRSIDIGDTTRIVCTVGSEEATMIDLILAAKNFKTRAQTLATLLSNNSIDLLEVKYIDLRFDEPLIGKKKAKRS